MDKLYEIGNVSLKWLGQMGFLIKTDNIRLCIDYFASPDDLRQTTVPIPAGELKDVDMFLGTPDHLDHIDHEAWKIWAKTNCFQMYSAERMRIMFQRSGFHKAWRWTYTPEE